MAAGPACVAVKLQLACFERLGAPGWEALESTVAVARDHGLLVLADGKRGDVPVTAHAYAQALVGETPTPVRPGGRARRRRLHRQPAARRDSLEPLSTRPRRPARAASCSSAPPTPAPRRSRTRAIRRCASGSPALVEQAGAAQLGECGLSLVGAVTGATQPALLARLRELMPRAVFLLPGVGAQGGRVEDLAPAFAPHPAAGLITASRSIVNAHAERGGEPARAAAEAAEELREAAWKL